MTLHIWRKKKKKVFSPDSPGRLYTYESTRALIFYERKCCNLYHCEANYKLRVSLSLLTYIGVDLQRFMILILWEKIWRKSGTIISFANVFVLNSTYAMHYLDTACTRHAVKHNTYSLSLSLSLSLYSLRLITALQHSWTHGLERSLSIWEGY